jgi:hypothetical protein
MVLSFICVSRMSFLVVLIPVIERNKAGIARLAVIPRRCSRSIYSWPDTAPGNK